MALPDLKRFRLTKPLVLFTVTRPLPVQPSRLQPDVLILIHAGAIVKWNSRLSHFLWLKLPFLPYARGNITA